MFVTNQIKGEGNSFQQDRVGYISSENNSGEKVALMWCSDGHGRSHCVNRYDIGGVIADTVNSILSDVSGDTIQAIYETEFEGQRLYSHLQDKILQIKNEFFKSKGWEKLVDTSGTELDGLWVKPDKNITTGNGGTTLIMVAMVKTADNWNARLYNVGDSLMIHGDMVYSQPGIESLNLSTVKSLLDSGNSTFYAAVPNSRASTHSPYHEIGEVDTLTINPVPAIIGNKHQYFHATVRGDIALEVCKIYNWRNYRGVKKPFERLTCLASWSGIGDDQLPKWTSVPSYSDQFEIKGLISLTSDGIGDTLMNESPGEIMDSTSWFKYFTGHPMSCNDATAVPIKKNALFRNAWFHETFRTLNSDPPIKDPFYVLAKHKFGNADNISRVTFIP